MKLEPDPKSDDAVVTVGKGVGLSVDSEGLATIYLRTEIDGIWVIEASSDLKEWSEVNAIKTTNGEDETTVSFHGGHWYGEGGEEGEVQESGTWHEPSDANQAHPDQLPPWRR